MTNQKLKTESHQGRPIEFSIDENGQLGIEFDDYPCAYRYMSAAKARELRDWLSRAFPDEPKAAPTIEPRIFRGNGPDCLGCGKTLPEHLTNYNFCPGLPENRSENSR